MSIVLIILSEPMKALRFDGVIKMQECTAISFDDA